MTDRQEDISQASGAHTARRFLLLSILAMLAALLAGLHLSWNAIDQRLLTTRAVHDITALDAGMRSHLLAGLPLSEFAGFDRIAGNMLQVAPEISAILVRDQAGGILLSRLRDGAATFPPLPEGSSLELDDGRLLDMQAEQHFIRLSMPLAGKLEPQGRLEVEVRRDPLKTFDPAYFGSLYLILLILLLVFWVFIRGIATAEETVRWRHSRPFLAGIFAILLLIMTGFLSITGLDKSSDTARAIATSFAARINQAISLGIDPGDLSGLSEITREMRGSDSLIALVALIEGRDIATASGLPQNADLRMVEEHPLTAIFELRPRQIYNRQYQVAAGLEAQTLILIILEQCWPLLLSCLVLPIVLLAARRRPGA